jgi:putative sigma-54 modulation protein
VIADRRDNHTFEAEIIVDAEHHEDFVAKASGPDLYACVDSAVDKLERQLTDHKERLRQRKGKTSMSG